MTSSVVGTGDGPKAFLPRSVPDLKLYIFFINFNGLEAKVDSDGGKIVLRELILYKPDEDG